MPIMLIVLAIKFVRVPSDFRRAIRTRHSKRVIHQSPMVTRMLSQVQLHRGLVLKLKRADRMQHALSAAQKLTFGETVHSLKQKLRLKNLRVIMVVRTNISRHGKYQSVQLTYVHSVSLDSPLTNRCKWLRGRSQLKSQPITSQQCLKVIWDPPYPLAKVSSMTCPYRRASRPRHTIFPSYIMSMSVFQIGPMVNLFRCPRWKTAVRKLRLLTNSSLTSWMTLMSLVQLRFVVLLVMVLIVR